jgi:hypothetical protein
VRNELLLSACVLLSLAGCAQQPPAPYVPGSPPPVAQCVTPIDGNRPGPALVGQQYGMQMSPLPLNSVQFDGYGTAQSLAIQRIFASRTPTGTVQLTARLVSCLDYPSTVRIRAAFLRADESPAEPVSAWREVHLSPRATATYTEYSTAQDVADFLIEIGAAQ